MYNSMGNIYQDYIRHLNEFIPTLSITILKINLSSRFFMSTLIFFSRNFRGLLSFINIQHVICSIILLILNYNFFALRRLNILSIGYNRFDKPIDYSSKRRDAP